MPDTSTLVIGAIGSALGLNTAGVVDLQSLAAAIPWTKIEETPVTALALLVLGMGYFIARRQRLYHEKVVAMLSRIRSEVDLEDLA